LAAQGHPPRWVGWLVPSGAMRAHGNLAAGAAVFSLVSNVPCSFRRSPDLMQIIALGYVGKKSPAALGVTSTPHSGRALGAEHPTRRAGDVWREKKKFVALPALPQLRF